MSDQLSILVITAGPDRRHSTEMLHLLVDHLHAAHRCTKDRHPIGKAYIGMDNSVATIITILNTQPPDNNRPAVIHRRILGCPAQFHGLLTDIG